MPTGPIITLTTDFGLTDFYVAAMKGVLLTHCPDARLLDVTHQIVSQDVAGGSFILERAISSFEYGSIHLAVVDPGVGTDRRLLVVEINRSTVICPDNGLITWALRRHPAAVARELRWRPSTSSQTFHGRDVMAPVASMLAAGKQSKEFCGEMVDPILLDLHLANSKDGQVIHIDHYGNATTNIPAKQISSKISFVNIGHQKLPLKRTYGEVAIGDPIALIGSSDLLEIAVRNGNAARTLKLKPGDRVSIE